MKKGGRAKAPVSQPVKGKLDTAKPKGGKRIFGFAGKPKPGKKK